MATKAKIYRFFVNGHNLTDRQTMEESVFGDADVAGTRLNKWLRREGQKCVYEYDSGDSWKHELLREKILEPEAGVAYPRCLKGKRASPPEDCGGVWGYQELLEVLQDSTAGKPVLYIMMRAGQASRPFPDLDRLPGDL
jgi:hypothetical protein